MTLDTKVQQEYKILAEYKMLMSENVRGIYVIPSHENSLQWFGIIFVRDGVYKEGIFRFTINLPDTFPNDKKAPVVTLKTNIFHPFVCPTTNKLDTRDAFPEWDSSCHIWQLLKYLIFMLEQPDVCLSSPLNDKEEGTCERNQEALEMLKLNRSQFVTRVKECVQESQKNVLEPPELDDKHAIVFEQWQDDVHGAILEKIRNNQEIQQIPPQDKAGGYS
uniref:Putative ubiquitin conjugating enzyme n=1 Tax=Nyssomyia neivai TaxID=330878 RepID=A0A1L8DT31_9DIPT